MKLLAVETATGCQSVALMDGLILLARCDLHTAGHHGKHLIPTIDKVLRTAGHELSDIQGLAVSIGPGSFTGLRVGLATMMGFRMVTGMPLAAVPTLEAMAWNLRSSPMRLCPILKARTGEVYWAFYEWKESGLMQIGEDQVGPLCKLAEALTEPPWCTARAGRQTVRSYAACQHIRQDGTRSRRRYDGCLCGECWIGG